MANYDNTRYTYAQVLAGLLMLTSFLSQPSRNPLKVHITSDVHFCTTTNVPKILFRIQPEADKQHIDMKI